MDRFYNSNRQSMTSYLDIFKACRLCGSGGGYKMPIIQKINNDDIVDVEAELKEKIKECVSIEVNRDDRMPPLICELCVDKVNDFYEFREMCRATNARVRASLGLPPQTLSQDVNEDCILGVSGPVFHSSKEPERPATPKGPKKETKNNAKKPQLNIAKNMFEKRQTRNTPVPLPPPLLTERSSRRRQAESPVPVHNAKKLRFASPAARPVSPVPELKRRSDKSRRSVEVVSELPKRVSEGKKSKELQPSAVEKKGKEPKEAPLKIVREAPVKVKEVPKKKEIVFPFKCEVCAAGFMKQVAYKQHQISIHTATIIPEKMSCIPCRKWFTTIKETDAHHRWHRSSGSYYQCHRCSTDFKVLMGFTKHFQLKQCMPWTTVPDVPCPVCLKTFATETWMSYHKCSGPPPVGDKCSKCPDTFTSRIQLKRHERNCKGVLVEVNPNNPHLGDLRDLSIPVDRCDNLYMRIKQEPGLLTEQTIKSEPKDYEEESNVEPVYIKQEIKQEYNEYDNDNGFGDTYSSNESENEAPIPRPNLVINPFARKSISQVDSLSVISLRSIFSTKLFKKKSKSKKKKQKLANTVSAFDALIVKTEPVDVPENDFDHMDSDVPMRDADLPTHEDNTVESQTLEGRSFNELIHGTTSEVPEGSEVNVNETNEGPEVASEEKITEDGNKQLPESDSSKLPESESSKLPDSESSKLPESESSKFTNAASDMFEADKSEDEINNFGFDIQMAVDEVEKSLNDDENTPKIDSETLDETSIDKDNVSSTTPPEEEEDARLVMENLLGQVDSLEKDSAIETAKTTEYVESPSVTDDNRALKENSNLGCTQEELDKKELDEIINEIKEAELTEGRSAKTDLVREVTNYSEQGCLPGKSMEEACGLDPEVAAMLAEDDIDSEINSVLQGELSPFIMQKRQVKVSLEMEESIVKKTDADVDKETEILLGSDDAAVEKAEGKETGGVVADGDDLQLAREESFLGNAMDEAADTIQDLKESASRIEEIIQESNKTDLDKKLQEEIKTDKVPTKTEEELNKLESEGDVMDLISDSGDDCNIVDSPEKNKALDDQLLDADLLEESDDARKTKFEDDALEEERLLQDDPMDSTESNPTVSIPEESKPTAFDSVDSNTLDSNFLELNPVDTNPIEPRESPPFVDDLMDVSLNDAHPGVSKDAEADAQFSDQLVSNPAENEEVLKSNCVQSVVQEQSVIRSVEDYKKLAVLSIKTDDVDLDAVSDDDFDMDS